MQPLGGLRAVQVGKLISKYWAGQDYQMLLLVTIGGEEELPPCIGLHAIHLPTLGWGPLRTFLCQKFLDIVV